MSCGSMPAINRFALVAVWLGAVALGCTAPLDYGPALAEPKDASTAADACSCSIVDAGSDAGTNVDPASAYDPAQDDFVVHEWGTFTSVVGTDGTLLPGLHHEEEDLPGFVYDRLTQAKVRPSVVQKMETPVTYFYSSSRRAITARVAFPNGLFTQWFPQVADMQPGLGMDDQGHATDPWQRTDSTLSQQCIDRIENELQTNGFVNGLLDWGNVEVMPRDATPELPGPLGESTWGFARQTASNLVRITNDASGQSEIEKFLFYRGLANFTLPLTVSASPVAAAGDHWTLHNDDPAQAMRGLFLANVTSSGAGYVALDDLAPSGSQIIGVPAATLTHEAFVAQLSDALADRLVKSGLYTDEANAMVDTWQRSYFLTPGLRLLYLLPQQQADKVIPLTIEPKPDQLVRVMVIRVELMTSAEEAQVSSLLTTITSGSAEEGQAARAELFKLGRFTEPALSRAIALSSDAAEKAAGQKLLETVRQKRRWAPRTAE